MNIIKQKRNEKNDEGDEGYSLGRPELDFRAFQKERAQIIINESNSRNFMRVLFVRHLSMAYCYRAHWNRPLTQLQTGNNMEIHLLLKIHFSWFA